MNGFNVVVDGIFSDVVWIRCYFMCIVVFIMKYCLSDVAGLVSCLNEGVHGVTRKFSFLPHL